MAWEASLLLIIIPLVFTQDVNYRDVRTVQGVVRGYKAQGENVFSFYNIPYATAPTGPDKYKSPLAPPTWNATFDAVDQKIICHQPTGNSELQMQEQCLIANVFVPDTQTKNLPVVVIVHGGAFLFGYGNSEQPKNLVKSGKMIAVTFNYRLGPKGFLCLGTESAPGNAGVKDQVALLQWVQRNIAQFNGNPNDVTIAGCSAGSSSVDLLIISKMTKGLFNKAIPGSGSNLNAFTVQTEPLENAKLFAKSASFNKTNDISELEKFYLDTPYESLSLQTLQLMSTTNSVTLFSPCVEKDVGQEIFLDDSPLNILKNGTDVKIPMLYGYAEMEGMFRLNAFDTWKTRMNDNFIDFLPPDIGNNNEERQKLANDIKHFYFGNEPITNSSILDYIDFFTDVMFGYAMLRSAKLQVESGNKNLYFYEYAFVDESKPYIPHTNRRGATHCDQFEVVMDSPNEDNLSEELKKMKAVMRDLWINFITTGVPVPQDSSYPNWPSMTLERSYMSLNNTLEYRDSLVPDRAKFWDNITEHYYKSPSPPNPTSGTTSVKNSSLILTLLFFAQIIYFICLR